jgi:hypothetical protein
MRSTGEFQIHRYSQSFNKFNEPIYLIPFGDIHKYAPMHAEERWQEVLDWARNKPRCMFLGMGDYFDLASAKERMFFGEGRLHESTDDTLDNLAMKMVLGFAKEIKFMNGKLIGLIEGNHYWVFPNGMTSTQKLCEVLECKYLGNAAMIRLVLKPATRPSSTMKLDIIAHHGRGTSRVAGGDMRAVEQLADMTECDIALMGDNHRKGVQYKERLLLCEAGGAIRIKAKKILMARTGSFLKGYEPGKKSYVVDAAYQPTDLGLVKIELTPKRSFKDNKDEAYIDIHASV